MFKLIAICRKEIHILLRDKAALATLFFMPMVLVLIVTLIQNNILETSDQSKVKLIFINLDEGTLGKNLKDGLVASNFFDLVETLDGKAFNKQLMRQAIAKGDYQAGIIIPKNASKIAQKNIKNTMSGRPPMTEGKTVSLLFDPSIQHALHITITSMIHQLVQAEDIKLLLQEEQHILEQRKLIPKNQKNSLLSAATTLLQTKNNQIQEDFASLEENNLRPNAVQHNVPAWSMFAIFFISLPLAAGIIRERNEGTLTRLRTLPVSIGMFFFGKIITYTMISLFQLMLMLWIGKSILPLFGTPSLDLGNQPELIILVGICAGLAASGLGVLFGVTAKNYDQVASAAPIVIVIAAAIGGIMIPVFMMPDFIQPLSNFSPLHWGHEAFIDIFLRGADISLLWGNLARLLVFFLLTTAISILLFRRL